MMNNDISNTDSLSCECIQAIQSINDKLFLTDSDIRCSLTTIISYLIGNGNGLQVKDLKNLELKSQQWKDVLKLATSVILFNSKHSIVCKKGLSRQLFMQLIHLTAIAASSPTFNEFRTIIGKGQLRILEDISTDTISVRLAKFDIFLLVLRLSPQLDKVLDDPTIVSAFWNSIRSLDNIPLEKRSKQTEKLINFGIQSSKVQSLLINLMKKDMSINTLSLSVTVISCLSGILHHHSRHSHITDSSKLMDTDSSSKTDELSFFLKTVFIRCVEQRPSNDLIQAFYPLFQILTENDLVSSSFNIIGLITRLLKRQPEIYLPSFILLIHYVPCDISPLSIRLIKDSGLLDIIKTDKPELFVLARQFLETIIKKITDPTILKMCLDILYTPILSVMKAHEKLNYIECFYQTIVHSIHIQSDILGTLLFPYFDKTSYFITKGITRSELNESIRMRCLHITGYFLKLYGIDDTIEHILIMLQTILNDSKLSDKIKLSTVEAFAFAMDSTKHSLNNPKLLTILTNIMDFIMVFIPNSHTKQTARVLSLTSILILLRFEKHYPNSIEPTLINSKLKQILCQSNSFLNNVTVIGKSTKLELIIHLEIINEIFNRPNMKVGNILIGTSHPCHQHITLGSLDSSNTLTTIQFPPNHDVISHMMEDGYVYYFQGILAVWITIVETKLFDYIDYIHNHHSLSIVTHLVYESPFVLIPSYSNCLYGVQSNNQILRLFSIAYYNLLIDLHQHPNQLTQHKLNGHVFNDYIPSKKSLQHIMKMILNIFFENNLILTDDSWTLLCLISSHPFIQFIHTTEHSIYKEHYIKHLILHPKYNKNIINQTVMFPPLVPHLECILRLFQLFFSHDSMRLNSCLFQESIIQLFTLADPNVSLKIEQTCSEILPGYSHNHLVDFTRMMTEFIVNKLPISKFIDLDHDSIQLYYHPDGILFIEDTLFKPIDVKKMALHNKQSNLLSSDDHSTNIGQTPVSLSHYAGVSTKQTKSTGRIASSEQKTERNKTKLEIQQDQIHSQSIRRAKLSNDLSQLKMLFFCLNIISSTNFNDFQRIIPRLNKLCLQLLNCPITVSVTMNLIQHLATKTIPRILLPYPNLIPDALLCVALKRKITDQRLLGMLRGVSNTVPISAAALSFVEPIVHSILSDSMAYTTTEYIAALQFLGRQLQPEYSHIDSVLAVESLSKLLKHQPSQIGLASIVLDAICRKYLNESLVSAISLIGQHDDPTVRFSIVVALRQATCSLKNAEAFFYVCTWDKDQSPTQDLAKEIRKEFGLGLNRHTFDEIFQFLSGENSVQFSTIAGTAYAKAIVDCEDVISVQEALTMLFNHYVTATTLAHRMGLIQAATEICRSGLITTETEINEIFVFLIGIALNDETLSTEPDSKSASLVAALETLGLEAINNAKEELHPKLHKVVENAQQSPATHNGVVSPLGKNRAIVDAAGALFFGCLAKYAKQSNPTVKYILEKLLLRIKDSSSPTREVQRKIANVIPPLVKSCHLSKQIIPGELISSVLNEAFTNESYVARNGSALALAAIIKGLGIISLKENNVMQILSEAAEDKNNAVRRQGSLLCFQSLSEILGRLFEPYVVQILSTLLTAFSDTSVPVRCAAQDAAKAIMSSLSAHGVKLVLPNLLNKIVDKQWRTRLGSIEALGAMAHCAPRQLAALLPLVVPQLCEVVSDSNPKVKEAASDALHAIASVVTNREIKAMAPILLNALVHPGNDSAKPALDALLHTEFVNRVDSPSLALVCPIVVRALRERSSETKRKAAAIVGSMVYLCNEPKDFLPYFPQVCPQLLETLVDPIPDVRAIAAKAFGTIAKGLNEESLNELLSWLLEKLKSTDSSVERSGAANGLSEVLASLGVEKLNELLPGLLQNAETSQSDIREGYLGLFVYLPTSFGNDFQRFIPDVLPVLLRGLSSEVESLRDVAFRAAEVLVSHYGSTHTVLLLTPLEDGVFNSDWRIRYSSISLLGTLVDGLLRFNSGYPLEGGEAEVLSVERRAFILSSLYIVRSDENPVVRQQATQAWKQVVQNTPKTLKEILPILLRRLINHLSSPSPLKQQVAAACIGDIATKLPDRVIHNLIPKLLSLLSHSSEVSRHGACLGLSELVNRVPANLLARYSTEMLASVQKTLCDDHPVVREAATHCLTRLLDGFGNDALKDMITHILTVITEPPTYDINDIERPPRSAQLSGIIVLFETQHQALMHALVPLCSTLPLDLSKIRLMGTIASIRHPNALNYCIPRIFPSLILALTLGYQYKTSPPTHLEGLKEDSVLLKYNSDIFISEGLAAAEKIYRRCLTNDINLQSLFSLLLNSYSDPVSSTMTHDYCNGKQHVPSIIQHNTYGEIDSMNDLDETSLLPVHRIYKRAAISVLISKLIQIMGTETFLPFIPNVINVLVPLGLSDPSIFVRTKSIEAIGAMTIHIKRGESNWSYILTLRETIFKLICNPITNKEDPSIILIGLDIPNALDYFYTLYHSALLISDGESREIAAKGFGELIYHCPSEALYPIVVKITGPLIRAVADRTSSAIKAAILTTLKILIIKAGIHLRPLIPQLQISFNKCMSDPSSSVRRAAANGLNALATLSVTRTEALLGELCNSIVNQQDVSIKLSMLEALKDVLTLLPTPCSSTVLEKIIATTQTYINQKSATTIDHIQEAAADCLGAVLSFHFPTQHIPSFIDTHISIPLKSSDFDLRQNAALILAESIKYQPFWKKVENENAVPLLFKSMTLLLNDEQATNRRWGVIAYCRCIKQTARDSSIAYQFCLSLLPTATHSIKSFILSNDIATLMVALKNLKNLIKFKNLHELSEASLSFSSIHRDLLLQCSIDSLTIPHPAIKILAERVLFYVLEVAESRELIILNELELAKTLDAEQLQMLGYYTRRVLTKMPKTLSDSEEDEE